MFTIKNLDEIQDAGTYTCHAKNELGEFKENFHLQGMFENLLFLYVLLSRRHISKMYTTYLLNFIDP